MLLAIQIEAAHGGTGLLVHSGCVALGVAGRLALTAMRTADVGVGIAAGGSAVDGDRGATTAVALPVLQLVAASVFLLAFLVCLVGWKVSQGAEDGGVRGSVTPRGGTGSNKAVNVDLFLQRVSQGDVAPLPSRATVLAALFAFAYQASAVFIPAWLSWLSANKRGIERLGSSQSGVLVAFWAAIGVGRFFVVPSGERPNPRFASLCLAVGAGMLLLIWLHVNKIDDPKAAVAAVLFGLVLGPLYPWVVEKSAGEMSEDEKLNGLSIVVAFGIGGTLAASLITGVVNQMRASSLPCT
jgi:hypothetical protein